MICAPCCIRFALFSCYSLHIRWFLRFWTFYRRHTSLHVISTNFPGCAHHFPPYQWHFPWYSFNFTWYSHVVPWYSKHFAWSPSILHLFHAISMWPTTFYLILIPFYVVSAGFWPMLESFCMIFAPISMLLTSFTWPLATFYLISIYNSMRYSDHFTW